MKNTKALIKALQTIGFDPSEAIASAFDAIQTGERTPHDAAIVKAVLDDALAMAAAEKVRAAASDVHNIAKPPTA